MCMPTCDCNSFGEIDRGEGRGQVNQYVSPCTSKIYKVLMRECFFPPFFQDMISTLDPEKLKSADGKKKKDKHNPFIASIYMYIFLNQIYTVAPARVGARAL